MANLQGTGRRPVLLNREGNAGLCLHAADSGHYHGIAAWQASRDCHVELIESGSSQPGELDSRRDTANGDLNGIRG